MNTVKAYATHKPGTVLEPYEFELGSLGPEEVDVRVEYCGICHSDVSMMQNDWGLAEFPIVPGHEAVGIVSAAGDQVKGIQVGDRVGVGWFTASCMHCSQCMSGSHNLCPDVESTIIGRHGGFANKVRAHWSWTIPIPKALDPAKAGPLFCGGITVFNPIVLADVRPTDRVGVIGIGGLGHLALQFLNKWGCEVTAFTTSDAKREEAKQMGAHHVVNTRDESQLQAIQGSLDFILSTVNVSLDWSAYLDVLGPKGRLHNVGGVLEPLAIPAFSLIPGAKSVAGSPVGPPSVVRDMLAFCERHQIGPVTEHYPFSKINEAIQHLVDGKARYRVVLESDW